MKTESVSLIKSLVKNNETGSALVQSMVYFSVLATLAFVMSEQQVWRNKFTRQAIVKDKYEGIKTNVQDTASQASVVLDSEQVYDDPQL